MELPIGSQHRPVGLRIRVDAAESEAMEGVEHVIPSSSSRAASCREFSVEREELESNLYHAEHA